MTASYFLTWIKTLLIYANQQFIVIKKTITNEYDVWKNVRNVRKMLCGLFLPRVCFAWSYKNYFCKNFIFSKQYDQKKYNLHKYINLSQTKTIEKVMFRFLF